jgi:AAA+ superfamily predicted ATPase
MPTVDGFSSSLEHVLAEISLLDLYLREQVGRFRDQFQGQVTAGEGGLSAYYIPEAEVDRLLARRIAVPGGQAQNGYLVDQEAVELRTEIDDRVAATGPDISLRLSQLARSFALSPRDLEIVVICLAPEVDRSYERLYGYLQDDITRAYPSVDLILDLFGRRRPGKLSGRGRFGPGAPLLRHLLVTVRDDPGRPPGSLLGRTVRLEPRIVRFLLDDTDSDPENATAEACVNGNDPDERLSGLARLVVPNPASDPGDSGEPAHAALQHLAEGGDDELIVYCRDGAGVGLTPAIEAFARTRQSPVLELAGRRLAATTTTDFTDLLALIAREARLHDAVLHWTDGDALFGEDRRAHLDLLFAMIQRYPRPVLISGRADWSPTDAGYSPIQLGFARPDPEKRARLWATALGCRALDGTGASAGSGAAGDIDLLRLAATFRFDDQQIQAAAKAAHSLAGTAHPTEDDIYTACRAQSRNRLAAVARRVDTHYGWDDLILPEDRLQQLREITDQLRYRTLVYHDWGFSTSVAASRGLNVLFSGPPGTGKTLAAGILANTLGLDIYAIDLSSMVSKYIGETERNLARVFDAAETGNAVLFFDEADALFGKRTQIRDAHDRYANLETSYLLQKMEDHDGVVILATNLSKNLDEAFVRRLHFTVEFPVPDAEHRRRLWARLWPEATPLAPDLDLDLLAEKIDLPGGNLRTIALAAAFLAAADGGKVSLTHVIRAVRREYQKLGKVRMVDEFGDFPA